MTLTSVEICAGAGGTALGLERAGFEHKALVEIDADCCRTLRANRPGWPVFEADVRKAEWSFGPRQIDLLSGGVPCPPFSIAGARLGASDERDLFPYAIQLVRRMLPRAIMLENVRGLMQPRFAQYREDVRGALRVLGYESEWGLVYASHYGVPQLRPRAVLVAFRDHALARFSWPLPHRCMPQTVGEALYGLVAADGWEGARDWSAFANKIAPTLVGGSKKHGGADLGPTRARAEWATMGVNARSLADAPPQPGDTPPIRLTPAMCARLQGFPPDWVFVGRKTSAYRQIGNAFPPPVAGEIGMAIAAALKAC